MCVKTLSTRSALAVPHSGAAAPNMAALSLFAVAGLHREGRRLTRTQAAQSANPSQSKPSINCKEAAGIAVPARPHGDPNAVQVRGFGQVRGSRLRTGLAAAQQQKEEQHAQQHQQQQPAAAAALAQLVLTGNGQRAPSSHLDCVHLPALAPQPKPKPSSQPAHPKFAGLPTRAYFTPSLPSLFLRKHPTTTPTLLGTINTRCRCHALRPAPLVLGSVHARSLVSVVLPLAARRPPLAALPFDSCSPNLLAPPPSA